LKGDSIGQELEKAAKDAEQSFEKIVKDPKGALKNVEKA